MQASVDIDVPDGYRVVNYRRPNKGEQFLNRLCKVQTANFDFKEDCHFIVKPTEPAEEAATKFLNGLGDEIKALSERVAALEQAKEPKPEPQKYGLYGRPDGPEGICDYFQWHEESPFDSAGQAVAYAESHFMEDWRNRWRVYPYPEDGGKPVELREPEKWGLWGGTGGSEPYWFGQEDEGVCLESEEVIQEVRSLLEFPERWTPYPYPADGGMPMELRETPVTVSPGGTNYVYDQPVPTLWGVWLEQDSRWAGSNIGRGCCAFFCSKELAENYAADNNGEARPLPIEELIKDA